MCFLRTNTCLAETDLLKQYSYLWKKTIRKVTNVCFSNTLFTKSVLPSSQSGLGVSSAQLLALPVSLASEVGALEALEQDFGEQFEDKNFNSRLEEWSAVTGTIETPVTANESLKHLSETVKCLSR